VKLTYGALDSQTLVSTGTPLPVLATVVAPAGGLITNPMPAATPTLTNVASSASSVTLLAANANRLGATIFNDSTQPLYVKFGTTASVTSFTLIMIAGAYWETPFRYTGRLDGIWAAANGNARVTEVTA